MVVRNIWSDIRRKEILLHQEMLSEILKSQLQLHNIWKLITKSIQFWWLLNDVSITEWRAPLVLDVTTSLDEPPKSQNTTKDMSPKTSQVNFLLFVQITFDCLISPTLQRKFNVSCLRCQVVFLSKCRLWGCYYICASLTCVWASTVNNEVTLR